MSYWGQRYLKSQQKLLDKSTAEINKQIQKYYLAAWRQTSIDFEILYNRLMKTSDNPTPADLYKLDKYWQTQAQLTQRLTELNEKTIAELQRDFVRKYEVFYEGIAKPTDIPFGKINYEAVEQLISGIWCADGKNWSQRVWINTNLLQEKLNNELLNCVITGKKTSKLLEELQNDFGASFHRANTLVRTELAHLQSTAAINRYANAGCKYYEVLADDACDDCAEMAKDKYFITEPSPVPFHPNCRCCIIPVIEED